MSKASSPPPSRNTCSRATEADATAVLRDDVLITALAKGVLPLEHRDDQLACALWEWRDDLASAELQIEELNLDELGANLRTRSGVERATTPMLTMIQGQAEDQAGDGEPVGLTGEPSTTSAVDELAERRRRRRLRISRRAAIGVAVVAFGIASVGSVAAAGVATPGSVLWPLTKVVNKDRAYSLEARQSAREQLASARIAAENHDQAAVKQYLRSARDEAGRVRAKDGQDQLRAEVQQLEQQLASPETETNPPGGAPTTTPSPSGTDVPSSPAPSPSKSPSTSVSPSSSASPSAAPTSTSAGGRSDGPSGSPTTRSASGTGGSFSSLAPS